MGFVSFLLQQSRIPPLSRPSGELSPGTGSAVVYLIFHGKARGDIDEARYAVHRAL